MYDEIADLQAEKIKIMESLNEHQNSINDVQTEDTGLYDDLQIIIQQNKDRKFELDLELEEA